MAGTLSAQKVFYHIGWRCLLQEGANKSLTSGRWQPEKNTAALQIVLQTCLRKAQEASSRCLLYKACTGILITGPGMHICLAGQSDDLMVMMQENGVKVTLALFACLVELLILKLNAAYCNL